MIIGLLELTRIGNSQQFSKRVIAKGKGSQTLKAFIERAKAETNDIKYRVINMQTRKELTAKELQMAELN